MYVALYRKYRPKTFKDVISQDQITKVLKNEVRLKKIAHSYIFTGPKGTGKTTCAKIFSKAINCLNQKDGEACCECEICKNIEKENLLDISEIDGASNNGVNDVRILKNEANFVPTYCKYRVYIIDEAHMLSTSAFNSLLKIMEDPPKYVVFILATTDILKIPQTIISRCQRFDFNRIKVKDVEITIEKIAQNEKIDISKQAIEKISHISKGSLRDAISILDKASSSLSRIDVESLNKILNIVDSSYIQKINKAILKKDLFQIVKIINFLYSSGKNLEDFLLELINFYKEMFYFILFKEECKNFLEYYEYIDNLKSEDLFDLDVVGFILEDFLSYYEKIKQSSNQKLFLELSILKIASKYGNNKIRNEKDKNEKDKEVIAKKNSSKNEESLKEDLKKENNINRFIDIAKKNNIEIEEK